MSLQEPVLRAQTPPWDKPGESGALIRIYRSMFMVVFITTFVVSWKYAIEEYGPFYGFGLGWIPALVIGMVFAGMWPLGLVVGTGAFLVYQVMNL